jgi:hypothetical protein
MQMSSRKLSGMIAVAALVAFCAWATPSRSAAGAEAGNGTATPAATPAAAPAMAACASRQAQATVTDLGLLFGPASLVKMSAAPWAGQLGERVPATVCEESFCSTNSQCTCPGSTCVGGVCSAGSGGGGGGGGGGLPCNRTLCSTNASCTCPTYPTCVNHVCS